MPVGLTKPFQNDLNTSDNELKRLRKRWIRYPMFADSDMCFHPVCEVVFDLVY